MWKKRKKKNHPEILSQKIEEKAKEIKMKEENNAHGRQANGDSVLSYSWRGSIAISISIVIRNMIQEKFPVIKYIWVYYLHSHIYKQLMSQK